MKPDCSNLLLGEAYCVNGADKGPTAGGGAGAGAGAGGGGGREGKQERRRGVKEGGGRIVRKRDLTVSDTEGGVPYGWPFLNAPRLNYMRMGAKSEL